MSDFIVKVSAKASGQNKQRAVRRSGGSFGRRPYSAARRPAQADRNRTSVRCARLPCADRLDFGEKEVRKAARIASGAAYPMSSAADAGSKTSRVSLGALRPLAPYAFAHRARIGLRARRARRRFGRDAGGADRGPADDRLRILRRQRRPHPRLFPGDDRRRRGARARLRRPILPGDDARRTGGRRPSRRSLHPSDPARPELLRRREDRRHRLAPLRRHDPAQGDVRLLGVAGAAQSLPVRRRDRDDGGHQPQALGLRARGDPGHRAAALCGRALGQAALPPRPGQARRSHRLRHREPLGGARHAVVRRRIVHRRPLSRGRLRRL